MRGWPRRLLAACYGVYAIAAFGCVSTLTTLVIAAVPGLPRRRRLARHAARLAFRVIGIPIETRGLERLRDGPCVAVANHASYLDGIILTAALPPDFAFVIKKEVTAVPLLHLLLRRLGSEFVERFDRHRGAIDARRILRTAEAGQALAFFPEGTFQRAPGLGRFHSGAFAAAVRAGFPVVPVVIRGSRHILPSGARLLRHGRLQIIVRAPIRLEGAAGEQIRRLKAASRAAILEILDEPDLEGVTAAADEAGRDLPAPGGAVPFEEPRVG